MVMFCMPQKLVDLADKVLAIIQEIHNDKGYPYELKIEQKDDGLSVKLDRKVVVKLRWAGNEAVRLGLSPVIAYSCPPGWDKDSVKGKPFYTFNIDQKTVNDPALKEAIQDAWLEYQVVSSSPSFYMVLQEVCKKFAFKLDTTIWYLETDTILGEEENPQISYIDALGKYSPQKQEVSLDIEMIERVACCLNIPFDNLKKIAQVFQAAKVIIHLGRDIDGYVGFWDEDVPQFVAKESIISTFAMYMTYTFFSSNGRALEHFKKYAILLPKEMQKWQLLESVGMEKMRHFLLIFRQRDLLLDSDTLFQLIA